MGYWIGMGYWLFLATTFVVINIAYADFPAGVSLEKITSISNDQSNKRRPVAIRNAGDGSNRLFIVLQNGEIVIYDNATSDLLALSFLNISNRVDSQRNEQGLLGLAFHPDFSSNQIFYVNYIRDGNPDRTVIARYSVPLATPNQADENSEQVILEIEQDAGNQDPSNHNGGDIHFGLDGFLYIGMGDGGGGNDPGRHGQNLGSLLGKMLRIDVDSTPPSQPNKLCGLNAAYGIPRGNPFTFLLIDNFETQPATLSQALCPEIWALGLRNPFRWSFDRLTGDMFIGDVGQGAKEEISFQFAEQAGLNFGWRCREGDQALSVAVNDPACAQGPVIPFTDPILVYGRDQGFSVTGGYRYRGAYQPLQGTYIYGDFGSGQLWFANESNDIWSNTHEVASGLRISSFGEDENGEIYLSDLSGDIYRLNTPVLVPKQQ